MKYKNIIIFGPQGSGKGTQAEVLSQSFGIVHVATGDIFRQNVEDGTELGKKVEEVMNAGNLISDEITNEIVKERLGQDDCRAGFVLDGYPRNLNQAGFLDKIVKVDLVLEVWISDDEGVMRIGRRRTCPKCGVVYHLKFNPPKAEGVCDDCGENLEIRDDDKEELVRKRLEKYHKQTEPLIGYYKEKGVYRRVDGMPSIPEVTESIMKIVSS